MARSAQVTPQAGGAPDTSLCAAMHAMQEAGLGPLGWLTPVWVEHMQEVGHDLAEFVAARIREDVRTQQRILRCRTIDELREVQTAFIAGAFEDYAAETGRLVTLNEDTMARAVARLERRAG